MLVGTELAAKGIGDIMVLNDSMAGADLTVSGLLLHNQGQTQNTCSTLSLNLEWGTV